MQKTLLWLLSLAVIGAGGWWWYSTDRIQAPTEEPAVVDHPELPEDDRQFLWDAEHCGLELGKYGWNPWLKTGLIPSDNDLLRSALAEGFTASWKSSGDAEIQSGLSLSDTSSDAAPQEIDGEGFLKEMLRCRTLFGDEIRTHFKLLAVHPVDAENHEGPWAGRGRITLTGTSPEGQTTSCQLHLTYMTLPPEKAAMEKGGWLLSCQVHRENRVQSAAPLFVDVTEDVGLSRDRLHDNWKSKDLQVNTGGIYLCDYNLDGCTDMLITDMKDFAGLIMYRGNPDGTFSDVTIDLGIPRVPETIDALFADIDNDGWEDLILPGRMVLRNVAGTQFEDITDKSNLNQAILDVGGDRGWLSISGASVADYDCDGLPDIYVTRADALDFKEGSWIDGKSGQEFGNQLLRNKGNFQFEDVTLATNTMGGRRSIFTSTWLDANNDTWPDVYVINEFGSGMLLLNQEGKTFLEVELDDESADFASMGLTCGDFNNDGNVDLYVSNMFSSAGNRVMDNLPSGHYDADTMYKLRRMVAGNQLHLNNGDLQFTGKAADYDVAQVGWGWGPAAADFNNDGWLDLYATCGFMSHTRAEPDG